MTRYRENHDWTMDWTIRAHRKAYWATVIYYYGIKRNQRIFEGDSIVRKTDANESSHFRLQSKKTEV